MLTKRKQQNLLFLFLGIIIGIMIAGLIAYFSVIKQFTQTNIDKIQSVLPLIEQDTLIDKPETIKKHQRQTNTRNNNNLYVEEAYTLVDSSLNDSINLTNTEIIKSDTKITSRILSISHLESDSNETSESYSSEISVEQWENPTNFAGYRKNKNSLIIYGISLDEIELQEINGTLFLIFKDKKLSLKETNIFIRFPASFLGK